VTIKEMIALTDKAKEAAKAEAKAKPGLFKRAAVALWMAWERCFNVLFRIVDVGCGSIFHYRIRPYRGDTLALDDGQAIRNNDKIIELHFDNDKLLHVMTNARSVVQIAIFLIREVGKALPQLAKHMEGRPEFDDVKGLYGVSMV